MGCQKKEENDDEALVLLALAAASSGPTCAVTISINGRDRTVNAPITAITSANLNSARQVSKTKVSPVGIDHEIGAVTYTAAANSKLTFSGQHYVLVYKKSDACPISSSNLATINTTYSHSSATDSSSALANSYLVNSSNTITFLQADTYVVVVYTGVTFSGTTPVNVTLTQL
ncbi:MAG: hypothetical protein MH321_11120 [Leptospiraceae bacterium]|nr:hypothetical protein [Leptospiraceae bacterium]